MAGLSLLPTITSDILGSSANILLAFLALNYARLLTKRQPGNFVWGYLYYVTFAFFFSPFPEEWGIWSSNFS